MSTWEYRSVTVEVDAPGDPLPALGAHGWEAYAAVPMAWDGYAASEVTKLCVLLKRGG